MRHLRREQGRGGLVGAHLAQGWCVTQQREVALVGEQGVGARVRGDDYGIELPGAAQGRMLGRVEREIGESVIDQVDASTVHAEQRVVAAQLPRIGNDGLDSRACEQALIEQELGVEVLLLWHGVDDGDACGPALSSGGLPFAYEHRDDCLLERIDRLAARHHVPHVLAAGALRARQHRRQQCATWVGVDFDEAELSRFEMKVEAEEHPRIARIVAGGLRRTGEHGALEGRQRGDVLDGQHHVAHALRVCVADEHRLRRKQMRIALLHQGVQPGLAQFGLQRLGQLDSVQADAETIAVETFDHGRFRGQRRRRGSAATIPARRHATACCPGCG